MKAISTQSLRHWDDLKIFQNRGDWMFRGQENAAWPLVTSLERGCPLHYRELSKASQLEEQLLREFKRRYRPRALHTPHLRDDLEWLSIMQHHGAPTRLLDFTYSIYVATYFAIESLSEGNCAAVWAVNATWARESTTQALRSAGWSGPELHWLENAVPSPDCEGFFSSLFFPRSLAPCAAPVNPYFLTERLTVQRGVFLCIGDPTQKAQANIEAMEPDADAAVKLEIASSLRKDFIKRLHDMRIDRSSLFPGLDGFAKSLLYYHPVSPDQSQCVKPNSTAR